MIISNTNRPYFEANCDVRCEFMLEYSVLACGGNRGIAPFIINLGTKRRPVIGFTSRQVYLQGKYRQTCSGRLAEGRISVSRRRFQPRIYQPIA